MGRIDHVRRGLARSLGGVGSSALPSDSDADVGNRYARPYRGVRVMVLGATGFIGRWVARYLAAAGADLHLGVRRPALAATVCGEYGFAGTVHELDATDFKEVKGMLERVRPTVTFNLVGYGVDRGERDLTLAMRINSEFVEALCELLPSVWESQWAGQRLVHVGTALEYGMAADDLSEDSVPQPTDWYGKTKLGGTAAVQRCSRGLGLAVVTARVFTVYGDGEHPGRLLPSLRKAARSGSALELTDGTQRRDFTYVEDVASGLLRIGAVFEVPGGTVNLATGSLTTVREFVETGAEILRMRPDHLLFGSLPGRPEEMQHAPVTIERLKAVTGWAPTTSVRDGILRTVRFALERNGIELRT